MRSCLVSLFILLNLCTVFRMNFPAPLSRALARWESALSPAWQLRIRLFSYRFHQYAWWTGLDPRWEMFSNVKGKDWRYRIEAVLESRESRESGTSAAPDARLVRLPLAGQSPRRWSEDLFFDFKEGKMRLNTAADRNGREAYARFLCRKFPVLEGSRVASVRISIEYQRILEPREAIRLGRHYAPEVEVHALTEARCAAA